MRIRIHSNSAVLDTKLRRAIERHVHGALHRFSARIRDVSVYARDVNGPRGGADHECRIDIQLEPAGRVVVAKSGADVWPLVNLIAQRATLAMGRYFDRQRDNKRRGTKRIPQAAVA